MTEVTYFRRGKQRRRRIGACGNAGSASNARRRIHRRVRRNLRNENGVRVLCAACRSGDETAGGDNSVEGSAINYKIANGKFVRQGTFYDLQPILDNLKF